MLCAVLAVSSFAVLAASPQDPSAAPEPAPSETEAAERAARVTSSIETALSWLVRHQERDGSWDADGFMKHDVDGPKCDGAGVPVHDVGITGLATLALISGGSTTRAGRHREPVQRATRWLTAQQEAKHGRIGEAATHDFVYDHAIATLALVEAYRLSPDPTLESIAQRAVKYLEFHRNPFKGWRYMPRDGDCDTSVTGWCVLALTAAREAELDVDATALRDARGWFEKMTDPVSGRCGYIERGGLSSRLVGNHATTFPRDKGECMTAMANLCHRLIDDQPADDPTLALQRDLILSKPPTRAHDGAAIDHCYWFLGTWALDDTEASARDTWGEALRTALLDAQRDDGNFAGSWDPNGVWGSQGGRVYSTALACLALQLQSRRSLIAR